MTFCPCDRNSRVSQRMLIVVGILRPRMSAGATAEETRTNETKIPRSRSPYLRSAPLDGAF
jgi:hypothetical protein